MEMSTIDTIDLSFVIFHLHSAEPILTLRALIALPQLLSLEMASEKKKAIYSARTVPQCEWHSGICQGIFALVCGKLCASCSGDVITASFQLR